MQNYSKTAIKDNYDPKHAPELTQHPLATRTGFEEALAMALRSGRNANREESIKAFLLSVENLAFYCAVHEPPVKLYMPQPGEEFNANTMQHGALSAVRHYRAPVAYALYPALLSDDSTMCHAVVLCTPDAVPRVAEYALLVDYGSIMTGLFTNADGQCETEEEERERRELAAVDMARHYQRMVQLWNSLSPVCVTRGLGRCAPELSLAAVCRCARPTNAR